MEPIAYYSPKLFFKQNEAYVKFRKLFDLNLFLFNESEILKDKISGLKIKKWEQNATSLIFLNSQHLIISILLVCNEGIKEAGTILLRSLFEKYIHLKYIIKHEQGRKFLLYSIVSKKKFFDMYEEKFPRSILLESDRYHNFKKGLEESFNRIKKDYIGKKGYSRNHWSEKKTRQMAEDLDEILTYDYIFKLYSAYIHCDPSSMEHYIIEEPGNTIFKNSPSVQGLEEILHLTEETFGRIVVEWAGTFHVEVPKTFFKYVRSKNT